MPLPEVSHGVWLYNSRVGVLVQRGDHTRFTFDPEYWRSRDRPVLGLRFEEHPGWGLSAKLRLPPWFSNLLPEGRLRDWIARERGVSVQREMELLAQVGHDLPGAIRVLPDAEAPAAWVSNGADLPHVASSALESGSADGPLPLRFSLAGVGMKFSMLQRGDRLVLPAGGEAGDWIVKLPDAHYPRVPRNEHTMMQLAQAAGIDVPEIRLLDRADFPDLPHNAWPNEETEAFAIRRFDRGPDRSLVHIEDLAQVRGFYPEQKYDGTFETIGALIYRGRDTLALREFAKRLAFFILIGNGDAHLKNWSLIYHDRRVPTLAPAYDIVSTVPYVPSEDLGLKFGGSRLMSRVSLASFESLQSKLDAPKAQLVDVVIDVAEQVLDLWPATASALDEIPTIRDAIGQQLSSRASALLGQ